MSDSEYFEAPSDSFWEINQYKRVVKRTEDGYKLSNDLMQMLSERANIEKLYSKALKSWSKKWNEYLEKCSEYGTMKSTWNGMATESNNLSELHLKIHDDIEESLLPDVKAWQKQNYPKTIMNTLKIAKQYEEDFFKAQKPWAKKYTAVEKAKKEYHSQCKQLQTARIAENNAKNDSTLSQEQKKKIEDKHEKHRKEAENAKHKYQQALDDLNENNARYIEDMKNVYKKCDVFEKQRLEYFIQKFQQVHTILDLSQKPQLNNIYGDFINTIKNTSPDKDLLAWSKLHGAAMGMNWPSFEEYSEELKNITKAEKKLKSNDDNGVTMTSIVKKDDSLPEPSSIRRILSFRRKSKRKSKTINVSTSTDINDNVNIINKNSYQQLPSSTSSSIQQSLSNSNQNVIKNRSSTLELNNESNKPVPPRRFDADDYPSTQNPFDDDFSDEETIINNNNNNKNNNNSINSHRDISSNLKNNSYTPSSKIAPTKPIITNERNDEFNVKENESNTSQPKKEDTNPFGSDSDDDTPSGISHVNENHNNFNRNSINHYGSNNSNNHSINSNHNNNNNNHHQQHSPPQPTQQYLNIKVRAIYDYQSTEDDELSFKAGEEFTKLANEDERGWCLGKIGNKVGLYPATYAVEP